MLEVEHGQGTEPSVAELRKCIQDDEPESDA